MDFKKIPPTRILQTVGFLDMLAAGLIMPQLANQARLLGGNHILIGVMGALYSAFQLISGPITGSLSDIKGRKPMLLLCLCMCGFAYVSLGITSSIMVFLSLRAFLGFTKQTQLLTKTMTPDYVKDAGQQTVVYGKLASLSGIGLSLGPIIGGHIMEAQPDYGFSFITTIIGTIFTINTVLIYNLPEIKKEDNAVKEKPKIPIAPKLKDTIFSTAKQSLDEFYKIDWTVYWDVFIFKLLITICMGLYFTSFALFLKTSHKVSHKNLGYIVSFQGIIGSLCSYLMGYITKFYKDDNDFSQRIFHIFCTLTITLLGMASVPTVSLYVALLIPFAICGSVGRIVTLEILTSRSNSSNRGTVVGASSSVKSLSGVFTPLLTGFIGQYFGIIYVLYLATCFAATGIILSYKINNNSQNQSEKIKKS